MAGKYSAILDAYESGKVKNRAGASTVMSGNTTKKAPAKKKAKAKKKVEEKRDPSLSLTSLLAKKARSYFK